MEKKQKKMKKTNKTEIVSKSDFEAYVAVQRSGITKMTNKIMVCRLASLSLNQYHDIIKNYNSYSKRFRVRM